VWCLEDSSSKVLLQFGLSVDGESLEQVKVKVEKELAQLAEEITLVSLYTPASLDDLHKTKDFLDEKLTEFSQLSFELGQVNLALRLREQGFKVVKK